ncbi:MAG: HDOD domain-containing protein [Candidatus Thiodiazotropha sp. (ex Epidulcina cf. delphinae)]|nr:HDOD domain-containing protein [Candidatus Thiodiazotropha sp. (ex Epidulcina cf. delphinae)]
MTQTVQEWANRLSADPLPVMRRILTQVRDLLHKSSVNHGRLFEIISRDPGFSLYIMQRLSKLPNPPKEPVTSISLAIPLLGMGLIEQASRTLPCLEDKLKGPPRRELIACYSRATHAAFYARGLVELQGQSDGDALYTGALLHDLGEMALWSADPELMRGIHRKIIDGDDRENAALEILGFTLEELSLQLSTKWRLPELIRDSQGLANSYLPKPLTVMLASALARETDLGWNRARTLDDIELLAEFLEIPQHRASAYLHRLSVEAARSLDSLPLPLPAFYLIGGGAETEEAIRQNAPLRPEQQAEPQVVTSPPATEPAAAGPAAKPQPEPGKRINPLQELLNGALQQMHDELGLSRVMFAMLDPDKTMLRARLVIESEQQLSLKGFTLSTKKSNLFTQLLKKPQAISLNKGNAEKYLSMIPRSALEQINPSGFIAMSVFLHNRPIGLFYADNGLSGPGVTRQQYENFKAICHKTIQTFNH